MNRRIDVDVTEGTDDMSLRAHTTLASAETRNRLGAWAESSELYITAQALFEQMGDSLHAARCQLGLAAAWHQLNRHAEARALCEAAQAIFRQHDAGRELAECDLLRAGTQRAQGQYHQAHEFAHRARERFEAEGLTLDRARSDVEIAYILACEQRYDEALALLAAADVIFSQAGATLEAAWAHRVQAVVYLDRGDYHRALDVLHAARAVYEAEGMQAALRSCDRNIANAYRRLGRSDEALPIYFRLREEFASQRMTLDVAICDMNIALAYKEQNRYADALTSFQRAVDVCLAAGLAVHAARCQTNMAQIEELLGAYDRAIEQHQRARDIFAQAGLEVNVAHCEENMARVHIATNQFDRARDLLDSAQRRFQAAGSMLHAAANRVYLAQVHRALNQHDRARELLEQARSAYAAENMPAQEALCVQHLADLEQSRGNAEEAASLYRRALQEFAQRQWPVNAALCELGLGETELAQDHVEEAQRWFTSALPVLDLDFPDWAWRVHYGLARCQIRRAPAQDSLDRYLAAIEAIRRGRAGLYTARGSSAFFAGRRHVYDEALALALQLGAMEQAVEIVEHGKAQAYLSMLANPSTGLRPHSHGGDASLDELLASERAAQARIEALRRALLSPDLGDEAKMPQAALLDQLAHARQAHEEIVARLFRARPLWSSLTHPPRFALDDFRRALATHWPNPWAVLAYYLSGSQLTVLFVDAESVTGWTRTLTPFEDRLLRVCTSPQEARRAEVYQRDVGGYRIAPGTGSAFLRQAYALLIPEPIRERLSPDRLLIVAPHGILHGLPFHALLSPNGNYLAQQATLVHAPSLHIFQLLLERDAGRPRPADEQSVLVIGVSDFGSRAPRLSSAAIEAEAIHRLFGWDSVVCLNAEANRAALLAMNDRAGLRHYAMLHFATHTIFEEEAPFQSRLMLHDGDLTALDLFDFALDADLVTLSSCESARSEAQVGDELIGLAQALFHAGTRALVAGLWHIPDESANVMMTRFYRALRAGQSPALALRTAQHELIAAGYTPFHWAPFIFLGHPGREAHRRDAEGAEKLKRTQRSPRLGGEA